MGLSLLYFKEKGMIRCRKSKKGWLIVVRSVAARGVARFSDKRFWWEEIVVQESSRVQTADVFQWFGSNADSDGLKFSNFNSN